MAFASIPSPTTWATPDDGLWNVQKHSGKFWEIHTPIPTYNQDTYQETWKDLNKII